jgi:hypothetical protein
MKRYLQGSVFTFLVTSLVALHPSELRADYHLNGYHPSSAEVAVKGQINIANRRIDHKLKKLESGDLASSQAKREELLAKQELIQQQDTSKWVELEHEASMIGGEYLTRKLEGEHDVKRDKKAEFVSFVENLNPFRGVIGEIFKPKPKPDLVPAQLPAGTYELPNIGYFPAAQVLDQGSVGSCTANSLDFIVKYLTVQNSAKPTDFLNNSARLDINRQFHYANTRALEADLAGFDWMKNYQAILDGDTGASMVASILAMDMYGAAPENGQYSLLNLKTPDDSGIIDYKGDGYVDIVNTFRCAPNPLCYVFALTPTINPFNLGSAFRQTGADIPNPYHQLGKNIMYKDVTTFFRNKYRPGQAVSAADKQAFIAQIIAGLQKGQPFYVGVMLDDSFMSDDRGFIPTPNIKTFRATGGHAIAIVGYGQYRTAAKSKNPDNKFYFKFINSWGTSWGDKGYGYLDAENYVAELSAFAVEGFLVSLPKATS